MQNPSEDWRNQTLQDVVVWHTKGGPNVPGQGLGRIDPVGFPRSPAMAGIQRHGLVLLVGHRLITGWLERHFHILRFAHLPGGQAAGTSVAVTSPKQRNNNNNKWQQAGTAAERKQLRRKHEKLLYHLRHSRPVTIPPVCDQQVPLQPRELRLLRHRGHFVAFSVLSADESLCYASWYGECKGHAWGKIPLQTHLND